MKYLIFALALISLHPSALAQLLIHGTVKSASDQSDLIGASIVVKGTSIGTVRIHDRSQLCGFSTTIHPD